MSESAPEPAAGSSRWLLTAIGLFVLLYTIAVSMGWPQSLTDGHGDHVAAGADTDSAVPDAGPAAHAAHEPPPYLMVIPFVLLLGAIAVFPLVHRLEHWWEANSSKLLVAAVLAGVVLLYYLLAHRAPLERHFPVHGEVAAATSGPSWALVGTLLQNSLLGEYLPFIVLLFALYTICGGIRITGDLRAHPATNAAFIGIGGLLASFVGTTGAAMLLIRALLETNSERKHVAHTVIFFIFVVCNTGGCLLPIGDPPLFLGYLRGVPFLWTTTLWAPWLLTNGLLVAIYWAWDHYYAYPREERRDIVRDETRVRRLRILGLWPNGLLLAGVVAAVALLDPSKTLPGTEIHSPVYLRETVLLALVGLSLALGSHDVRLQNKFNYGAILEVAALFLGIFICMQPALAILNVRGDDLGIDSPAKFFWITGALSSVLDNAPTYVVFFETARAIGGEDLVAGVPVSFLTAISLGAVFMGANTYIGNGPNFMVKAIAEKSGVRMPSFFGYMAYSFAILIPLFVLNTLLFFLTSSPVRWLFG